MNSSRFLCMIVSLFVHARVYVLSLVVAAHVPPSLFPSLSPPLPFMPGPLRSPQNMAHWLPICFQLAAISQGGFAGKRVSVPGSSFPVPSSLLPNNLPPSLFPRISVSQLSLSAIVFPRSPCHQGWLIRITLHYLSLLNNQPLPQLYQSDSNKKKNVINHAIFKQICQD